jgi:adenosine deaminase
LWTLQNKSRRASKEVLAK